MRKLKLINDPTNSKWPLLVDAETNEVIEGITEVVLHAEPTGIKAYITAVNFEVILELDKLYCIVREAEEDE